MIDGSKLNFLGGCLEDECIIKSGIERPMHLANLIEKAKTTMLQHIVGFFRKPGSVAEENGINQSTSSGLVRIFDATVRLAMDIGWLST